MNAQEKLAAMTEDLRAVARKHGMIVDKYAEENGPTRYRFKLQMEEASVDLEEVFSPVYHGPPLSN